MLEKSSLRLQLSSRQVNQPEEDSSLPKHWKLSKLLVILYNFPWLHYFIFHIVKTCNNFAIILLKYAVILHIFTKLLQNYCMFLQYEIWSNAVKENCTIYNNWLLQNWQNTLDPLLHTVNCVILMQPTLIILYCKQL